MQTKFLLTALASSLLFVVNGAVINVRDALDVFVPPITSPRASTVWEVGSVETVTWDASDAPDNISNGALVALRPAKSLTSPVILERGFDLRTGSVNVTVPDYITPGKYVIILFGDSGNISPAFKIVRPRPSVCPE